MILVQDMKVCRITIDGTYKTAAGEILVYYTQKEGQGFAPTKRYWFYADENSTSTYTAEMPLMNLKSVRIDPTTFAGNTMEINSVTFNRPKAFMQFFSLDAGNIFSLIVYSCLGAAVITLLKEIFSKEN